MFYVGSLILLALLLPYTAYKQGTSPFVTFLSSIGVLAAGDIRNFVVLTAALSSLNAGPCPTGRILRSMSLNGSAPKFTARMTNRGVPFAGSALTARFTLVGVFLNLVAPSEAFNIALDLSALGIVAAWATLVICQIQLHRWSKKGIIERSWNLITLVMVVLALTGGWHAVRPRVLAMARERVGYTVNYPVVAETPLMDELIDKDARQAASTPKEEGG